MLALYCILFFVLLLSSVPIFLSLGIPSILWFFSSGSPFVVYAQKFFNSCDSFAMMAIPFFMLAGNIMEKTDITQSLLDLANAAVGWIRGGIAHTVELAGILLAGLSGSSNADTSALAVLTLAPLRKSGYPDGWANAIVVSAGSIGPIIPPSITMIIFANAVGMNVGQLFMSGILPGILIGAGYMIVCYIYAKRHNIQREPFKGLKHLGVTFIRAFWALLMPIIIIGGILSGIFTATESGVIAVVYGIIYGFVRKKLTLNGLKECVVNAAKASVGPTTLVAVSSVFSYMLAREGIVTIIGNFAEGHIGTTFLFLMFNILICFIAGCFVDATATMLLLGPIMLPIAQSMGIAPLHFACVFVLANILGGMTPPVGTQLFVITAISKTPISKLMKPMFWFILVYLLALVIITLMPGLATYIPSLSLA
ncbi:MAG: TRAP transporter large permease [Christensenella sp.]